MHLDAHVFPIEIFQCEERVEPREVAAAITETFGRYDVRELICEPGDWTWVMLAMEFERLPIVKEPRSP